MSTENGEENLHNILEKGFQTSTEGIPIIKQEVMEDYVSPEESNDKCKILSFSEVTLNVKDEQIEVVSESESYECRETDDKQCHEETLTGKNLHKCQFCPKMFRQQGEKNIHEITHTGERPYKCEFCSEMFASVSIKNQHEASHHGKLPFKCQFCPKEFGHNSQKTLHERTHTDEKPFPCKFCFKTFACDIDKAHHERIHLGEISYTIAKEASHDDVTAHYRMWVIEARRRSRVDPTFRAQKGKELRSLARIGNEVSFSDKYLELSIAKRRQSRQRRQLRVEQRTKKF